jgi:hypothetical protein
MEVNGMTLLHHAATYDDAEFIRELASAFLPGGKLFAYDAREFTHGIDSMVVSYGSPLVCAVDHKAKNAAAVLVELGADPDQTNRFVAVQVSYPSQVSFSLVACFGMND